MYRRGDLAYKTERNLKKSEQKDSPQSDNDQHVASKAKEARTILKHGLAYIFTYVTMTTLVFLWKNTDWALTSLAFQIIHVTIRPLHGLFNFVIFVSHKVHNIRLADEDMSICEAIRTILRRRTESENIVTEIDVVDSYHLREREGHFNRVHDETHEQKKRVDIDNAPKSYHRASSVGLCSIIAYSKTATIGRHLESESLNTNGDIENLSYNPTITDNAFEGFEDEELSRDLELSEVNDSF